MKSLLVVLFSLMGGTLNREFQGFLTRHAAGRYLIIVLRCQPSPVVAWLPAGSVLVPAGGRVSSWLGCPKDKRQGKRLEGVKSRSNRRPALGELLHAQPPILGDGRIGGSHRGRGASICTTPLELLPGFHFAPTPAGRFRSRSLSARRLPGSGGRRRTLRPIGRRSPMASRSYSPPISDNERRWCTRVPCARRQDFHQAQVVGPGAWSLPADAPNG